jgi:hypothetical protein
MLDARIITEKSNQLVPDGCFTHWLQGQWERSPTVKLGKSFLHAIPKDGVEFHNLMDEKIPDGWAVKMVTEPFEIWSKEYNQTFGKEMAMIEYAKKVNWQRCRLAIPSSVDGLALTLVQLGWILPLNPILGLCASGYLLGVCTIKLIEFILARPLLKHLVELCKVSKLEKAIRWKTLPWRQSLMLMVLLFAKLNVFTALLWGPSLTFMWLDKSPINENVLYKWIKEHTPLKLIWKILKKVDEGIYSLLKTSPGSIGVWAFDHSFFVEALMHWLNDLPNLVKGTVHSQILKVLDIDELTAPQIRQGLVTQLQVTQGRHELTQKWGGIKTSFNDFQQRMQAGATWSDGGVSMFTTGIQTPKTATVKQLSQMTF